MIAPLATGYSVDVDAVAPDAWCDQVAAFNDANLYQVWERDAPSKRFKSVSRIAVNRGGAVIALAEVRQLRLPIVPLGVAYTLWGPLFKKGEAVVREDFRQAVRALRNEYAVRRGMVLRINPRLCVEQDQQLLPVLAEEGFSFVEHARASHSLLTDLTPDLEQIRRDLDKKWRNCLSKAERSDLSLAFGSSLDLFDQFVRIYERMLQRKQFVPSADIGRHRRVQQALPESMKMQIVIASNEAGPCAGAIYSALGDTAVYLFGATDDIGMKTSASYLVQWAIVKKLKELGFAYYDLNGVDPIRNPGTYHFKRGLAGNKAIEITFAGQFQAMKGSLANRCIELADRVRHQMQARKASVPQGAGAA
jgi:hypothetical protein